MTWQIRGSRAERLAWKTACSEVRSRMTKVKWRQVWCYYRHLPRKRVQLYSCEKTPLFSPFKLPQIIQEKLLPFTEEWLQCITQLMLPPVRHLGTSTPCHSLPLSHNLEVQAPKSLKNPMKNGDWPGLVAAKNSSGPPKSLFHTLQTTVTGRYTWNNLKYKKHGKGVFKTVLCPRVNW
jgi:hypothetical protein